MRASDNTSMATGVEKSAPGVSMLGAHFASRRLRLFVERCSSHIPRAQDREEFRRRFYRKIDMLRKEGAAVRLDPKFPLCATAADVDEDRIDVILDRFKELLICRQLSKAGDAHKELQEKNQKSSGKICQLLHFEAS